ncbi:MAG: outer membrane lipoprotein carrier protein LolA [Treponema sp.]|nr:outer membrane lipoprotein carrier protein LolA [Treponema sp.]
MKKFIFASLFFILMTASASLCAQVVTASEFFKSVSDYYATFNDYEADVDIKIGKDAMTGKVSFKKPEMLRIDFTEPPEQCVVFNGDDLVIYLPGSAAILEQHVDTNLANTATGLSLMRRYYTVQYKTGQDAVPLDSDSDEMVVKFVLYRRSSSEAFSQMEVSILPDEKLIRRIEAQTPAGVTYVFDFFNYHINTNMSEKRFVYDPPSSANNYNNFLLSE